MNANSVNICWPGTDTIIRWD